MRGKEWTEKCLTTDSMARLLGHSEGARRCILYVYRYDALYRTEQNSGLIITQGYLNQNVISLFL